LFEMFFEEQDQDGNLTPQARRIVRSVVLSWLSDQYAKNRGRIKSETISKAIIGGAIHKASMKEDAEGDRTIVEPEDPAAREDFEQVNRYLILRDVLEHVTDPKDKKAFELFWRHYLGDMSDAGYELEATAYGLTPKAIDHRLKDLTRKYPMLQQFNN
jgi:hypothetical protein